MELYNIMCVCIAILSSFGVFESAIKRTGVNKYVYAALSLLSCILTYLPQIAAEEFCVSLNFCLFFMIFVLAFLRTKNLSSLLKIFLISSITLALCVCYNSLNLLEFEFAYYQPYLALCPVFAIIFGFVTKDIKTTFCGLFVGISIAELIRSQNQMFYAQNVFTLGDLQFLTILVGTLSLYVLFTYAAKELGERKKKRQEKAITT